MAIKALEKCQNINIIDINQSSIYKINKMIFLKLQMDNRINGEFYFEIYI